MRRKLLAVALLAAAAVGSAQPAQALGGVCNGFVDTGCKVCLDYRYNPPRQTEPYNCLKNDPSDPYEWAECAYYVLGECFAG